MNTASFFDDENALPPLQATAMLDLTLKFQSDILRTAEFNFFQNHSPDRLARQLLYSGPLIHGNTDYTRNRKRPLAKNILTPQKQTIHAVKIEACGPPKIKRIRFEMAKSKQLQHCRVLRRTNSKVRTQLKFPSGTEQCNDDRISGLQSISDELTSFTLHSENSLADNQKSRYLIYRCTCYPAVLDLEYSFSRCAS